MPSLPLDVKGKSKILTFVDSVSMFNRFILKKKKKHLHWWKAVGKFTQKFLPLLASRSSKFSLGASAVDILDMFKNNRPIFEVLYKLTLCYVLSSRPVINAGS